MIKRILTFVLAVIRHWGSLVTGGFLIGMLSIWQLTGHGVKPWIGWAVGLCAVLVACFKAWDVQQNASARIAATLQQELDKPLNIRRAIYKEMLYLYAQMIAMKKEVPHTDEAARKLVPFFKVLQTDSYDLAKSQADVFYKLPEAYKIDSLYGHLRVIQQMEGIHPQALREIADIFIQKTEEAFQDPAFDQRLFETIGQEAKRIFAKPRKQQEQASASQ